MKFITKPCTMEIAIGSGPHPVERVWIEISQREIDLNDDHAGMIGEKVEDALHVFRRLNNPLTGCNV